VPAMSLPVDYVGLITAFATSYLAGVMARDILRFHCTRNELWIALFFLLQLYLIVYLHARNYLYDELGKKSLWWQSRQNFLLFLYSVVIFTILQLLLEFVAFAISATRMETADWLNFMDFGIFFIFVFVQKLQYLLTYRVGSGDKEERQATDYEAKKDV
jgi:hypothetical protein